MSAVVHPVRPNPRIPARRPYTPEKPSAKAMTIAIGFLFNNGTEGYIAADRQFTAQGFFKYQAKKYANDEASSFLLTFAFAGDPGVFSEVRQKVCTQLGKEKVVSIEIVKSTIERVIKSLSLRGSESLFMLVGVNEIFDPPSLIVFDGKSVFLAENNKVYLVGCGETSLIRYLIDQLYGADMSKDQGLALAAYLIKKATQYVDYCGEPIDVLYGYELGFHEVEREKIQTAIQRVEEQEQFLSTLLIRTPFSP